MSTPAATMAGVQAPPKLEKKPVKFSNLLCTFSHLLEALGTNPKIGVSEGIRLSFLGLKS